MKNMLWAMMLFVFVPYAYGGDDQNSAKVTTEFSEAMGLDQMLEGIVEQTRASMILSVSDLSENIRTQLPELNEEQEEALAGIFRDYINRIMDSVDTEKAAEIYSGTIAEGLPVEEIEAATDYYSSPEGQRLLVVVNEAAGNLNEYVLSQIMAATKDAQGIMLGRIQEFSASVAQDGQ